LWHENYILKEEHFDVLYDYLSQFEPHVKASKANKAVRNHDPLALVANSHVSPSYSRSPQPYYVTHPLSVIDNDNDYQGENQAVIQDGHMDIQSNNVGYARNGNRNAGRKNRNQVTNAGNGLVQKIEEYDLNVQRVPRIESTLRKINVLCYNCNGKGHYARECLKPRVYDAKYFREQMLLATKDEEENDFMLDNAYGDNTLAELNAAFISKVNASQIDMINGLLSKSDHEQCHHEKLETIIHTSTDDQIDSDIIFDDPYVENNSGQANMIQILMINLFTILNP
ncbi:retrovirus-related pol polyprotein from transposon TNT 1-94, partial [Tanacetum coccineum]